MKKIYFSFILLGTVLTGFSQTEKGSVLLGGNIDFTTTTTKGNGQFGSESNTKVFTLNPMIGIFPVNNFAVILNTNYSTITFDEGGNSSNLHALQIGPLFRYYFPASESVKFFAGAGIGWGSGEGMTSTVYQFQAGPAFYISRILALEFNLNYQTANVKYSGMYGSTSKESQFGISVGFMVYLGKGKS